LNASSAAGELNSGRINLTGAAAVTTGDVEINGIGLTAPAGATITQVLASINDQSGLTGVSATAYNSVEGLAGATGVTTTLTINGDVIENATGLEDLVTKINRDAAGVTAAINSDGGISLTNDTGNNIVVLNGANTGLTDGTYGGYLALSSADDSEIALSLGDAGTAADLAAFGFNAGVGSSLISGAAVTSDAVTASSDITINGTAVGASSSSNAADKAAAINAIADVTGVTADANTSATFSNIDFSQTVLNSTDLTINGVEVDATGITNINQLVSSINDAPGLQGVTASADQITGALVLESADGLDISVDLADGSRSFFGSDVAGVTTEVLVSIDETQLQAQFDASATSAGGELYISINSAAVVSVALDSTTATLAAVITGFDAVAGISASEVDGQLRLVSDTPAESLEIFLGPDAAASSVAGLTAGSSLFFFNNDDIVASETRGSITLESTDGEDIQIGGTASDIALLGVVEQGGAEGFSGLGLSVSTLENATNAISRIDAALDTISSRRGELGAVQNRLTSTISNLSSISQNLSAANSRIQDADFAQETASLTKTQILQQAGISILSQANAGSQSVLSLLG